LQLSEHPETAFGRVALLITFSSEVAPFSNSYHLIKPAITIIQAGKLYEKSSFMSRKKSNFLNNSLNFFFHHLYHTYAFLYDSVAFLASLGKWHYWAEELLPFASGKNILELAFGTGYLQQRLLSQSFFTIGVDESPQMVRIAKKRVDKINHTSEGRSVLLRSRAEFLPFTANFFNTILASFPASFIFLPQTLHNCYRCLVPNGKLVILVAASPIKSGFPSSLLSVVYRITGESITAEKEIMELIDPIVKVGFIPHVHWINSSGATLLVISAEKPQ
jgi:ubiquinone/menaquinone biosynthesis C-methylase UbiE